MFSIFKAKKPFAITNQDELNAATIRWEKEHETRTGNDRKKLREELSVLLQFAKQNSHPETDEYILEGAKNLAVLHLDRLQRLYDFTNIKPGETSIEQMQLSRLIALKDFADAIISEKDITEALEENTSKYTGRLATREVKATPECDFPRKNYALIQEIIEMVNAHRFGLQLNEEKSRERKSFT